jgi:5-methylcytosine-specific restriction endonuclease McrA
MPRLGEHLSEERKQSLRIFWAGRVISEKTKEAMRLSHTGNRLSAATRKKISDKAKERVKQGKCNLWRGGVTPIHLLIRESHEYKIWRDSVFRRDNYTCTVCGARTTQGKRVELHADHIKPFSVFPELRFLVDNGRTLCKGCHLNTPTFGKTRQQLEELKRRKLI